MTKTTSPFVRSPRASNQTSTNNVEVYLGGNGYLCMHFSDAVTVIQDGLVCIGCFTDVPGSEF